MEYFWFSLHTTQEFDDTSSNTKKTRWRKLKPEEKNKAEIHKRNEIDILWRILFDNHILSLMNE